MTAAAAPGAGAAASGWSVEVFHDALNVRCCVFNDVFVVVVVVAIVIITFLLPLLLLCYPLLLSGTSLVRYVVRDLFYASL